MVRICTSSVGCPVGAARDHRAGKSYCRGGRRAAKGNAPRAARPLVTLQPKWADAVAPVGVQNVMDWVLRDMVVKTP